MSRHDPSGDTSRDPAAREPDDELTALLALDALESLEQADAELRAGDFPAELRHVSALLAEDVATPPPADLRAAVLDRARSSRTPGMSVYDTTPCPPDEGFARTVTEFHALLESLGPDEWELPAHDDHGRVRDLVAHLVGIERLSARWLDPADDVPPILDHLTATDAVVAELRDIDGARLAAVWLAAARAVSTAAAVGDPQRAVSFHEMVTDVAGHLVIRTFELWAHSMDISLATGRPMLTLDDGRMLTLSQRFMRVAPLALEATGRSVPGRTVRFVLTGPAGGSYDVALHPAEQPGEPAAVVTADALDLCRLAARRLAPAELDADVDGDSDLVDRVLAGLGGLARD
jgi:uncharacterized protein (TIGR03083 family)